MPLVRMLTSYADAQFSWADGEQVQATPEEAQSWLAAGIAELVTGEATSIPERGQVRPEVRRGPGRPRKYPRG